MDIKGKTQEIVEKVKSDKDFAKEFSESPVKAVEKVIGVEEGRNKRC